MRLVHRRKERTLTRSTVPPTIPMNPAPPIARRRREGQRSTQKGRRELFEATRLGKGLLVASGLAYEY